MLSAVRVDETSSLLRYGFHHLECLRINIGHYPSEKAYLISFSARNLFLVLVLFFFGALTLWYGVFSTSSLPDHRWFHGQNDLLLHALAFGALMIPLVLLLDWISATLIASGAAVAIEVIQMWLPRREPALSDLAAGLVGIGLVVAGTLLTRKLLSRETKLVEKFK